MSSRDETIRDLRFIEQDNDPDYEGHVRYVNGTLKIRDGQGVYDPRAGSGLTEAVHRTLLQLIHFIDEGPAEGFTSGATKTVTGGLFPTLVEWRRQDGTLLVEKTITRSGGGATNLKPTPVVWKIYDTDGTTVLATVSDAITYSGLNEVSRVRTIS